MIKAEENATLFRSFLTGGGAGGLDRIHNGGGDGNPTFGFGFNLATAVAASHIDELFEHIYNGVLTVTQQNAVTMLSAWRMGSSVTITDDNGTSDSSDDVQLQIILTNADIFNGAQGVPVTREGFSDSGNAALNAELQSLQSLTLNEIQAQRLLDAATMGLTVPVNETPTLIVDSREQGLTTRIGGATVLPDSIERAVLSSLFYNTPGLVGTGVVNSLNADNRAAAWFEIRYNHAPQLQERRDRESDLFRLISRDGENNEDINEYKEALNHLFNGAGLSDNNPPASIYEFITVTRADFGLARFMADVEDELNFLEQNYTIVPGAMDPVDVDFVQVNTSEMDATLVALDATDKTSDDTINLLVGSD